MHLQIDNHVCPAPDKEPDTQSDNPKDNQELNNLLTENANLLETIQQKETLIKQLEIKLQEIEKSPNY